MTCNNSALCLTLSSYENNPSFPSLTTMFKIIKKYGILDTTSTDHSLFAVSVGAWQGTEIRPWVRGC